MTDQLPQFTRYAWVLREPDGGYEIDGEGIECCFIRCTPEVARAISLTPKIFRALVALAAVAKVQSDAEYRAVIDARDVIAEVMGS